MLAGCTSPASSPDPGATPTVEPNPSASPAPSKPVYWPSNIDFGAMNGKKITLNGGVPGYAQEIQDEFSEKYGVEFENLITQEVMNYITSGIRSELDILKFLCVTGKSPTVSGPEHMRRDPVAYENTNAYLSLPRAAIWGLVQPVDEWLDANPLDDTFIRGVSAATQWHGKQYALQPLPIVNTYRWSGSMAIIYNWSECNRSGIRHPLEAYRQGEWTWDELRRVSRQLSQPGTDGRAPKTGFLVSGAVIPTAMLLNDAAVYQDDGHGYQVTLRTQQAQETLMMFSEAIRQGEFIYKPAFEEEDFKKSNIYFSYVPTITGTFGESDKLQAVPMPAGSFAKNQHTFCMDEGYYLIGKGSPNPEIGFAWLWYSNNFTRDHTSLDERFEINPFKDNYHTKEWFELLENQLMDGDQVVLCGGNVWGMPGMPGAFRAMCTDIFQNNISINDAITGFEARAKNIFSELELQEVPDLPY
nr:hypothetical protein [bacterium]